jgi:hypothetical protein
MTENVQNLTKVETNESSNVVISDRVSASRQSVKSPQGEVSRTSGGDSVAKEPIVVGAAAATVPTNRPETGKGSEKMALSVFFMIVVLLFPLADGMMDWINFF